eukprot:CAMPEP_0195530850 /NCGR_PEP_ID=MMETSP0794_2-20130614/33937_1 /TAXON_ID=515487 /ORGANISM="Stephanopyxis turris, Strain CCMP 815" /LENGTH=958 /DNA_ID=CAMNT_0040662451 /DNA_START=84 /DNA_END=2960 /DNA_ORIENTATION=+
MGARLACIAAALFAPGVAGSSDTSEVHAVFQGVLSAVESYWSSVDSLGEGGSLDGGADALALVSDSGTIELEPLIWTGSSTNDHVQCTDCSVHATRTLTYNCTVVDGELQYLTVLVTTAGRAKLSYTATVDSTSSFAPITEPVEFVGSNTVTATFGGVSCDIDVSTNINTTLIAGTSSADAEQVSGEIQANLTTRAGFVYTADGGVQPIADETSQYWAEQFDIAANESPPPGVAAHVSLDLAQTVLIDGLVELKTITQPAMQIFSSPGDLIVSDSDFFYTQSFLCLFDSDCPNDEVCVSSGECISYQRQGGSTYCEYNECVAGDPGCDIDEDNCGGRTCNNDNCRIFHTHGDNLDKYNAKCCGVDEGSDLESSCEFYEVSHYYSFEEMPYYKFNAAGYDDFSPLLTSIANSESIICGMGSPLNCVRLDKIEPRDGSYYNGMLVTATVARNCGEMELFVMRAYDCFDDCDEIGSLPGLFHGSGAISRQRRLGQEADLRDEAVRRRRLTGPLDAIAEQCTESDVVNFAIHIGASVSVAVLDGAGQTSVETAVEPRLRSHLEPVDPGCIATELFQSEETEFLTMPVIVQDGTVFSGDVRYIGDDTDIDNENTFCADTYGFGGGEWGNGFMGGFDYASVSFQVANTTAPLSRVPTFSTRVLMEWGALPHNEVFSETLNKTIPASTPFACTIDTTVDIAIDLRISSVNVEESAPASAVGRQCTVAGSTTSLVPPELSFYGVVEPQRGNVLNLTDPNRCWQVSVTNFGNTPLAQGDCTCDTGYWRANCELAEDAGGECVPCPSLPNWQFYTTDGGAFWNGCVAETCPDDCGIGKYRKGCTSFDAGICANCTNPDQSANTPFISSGHYDDKCDVNYDLYITEGPVELVPGDYWAIGSAGLVVIGLIVLAIYLVKKKKQDRLNEVHSALQLTSKSAVKSEDSEDTTRDPSERNYDSFQTDADIVID